MSVCHVLVGWLLEKDDRAHWRLGDKEEGRMCLGNFLSKTNPTTDEPHTKLYEHCSSVYVCVDTYLKIRLLLLSKTGVISGFHGI